MKKRKTIKKISGNRCVNKMHESKCGNVIYGLGFIGAAIYFIGQSTTFWMGVLGVLKAIIWPVFFVYELFKYLGI